MLAKRSQLPFLKTILQETDYASPPVLEFDFVDASSGIAGEIGCRSSWPLSWPKEGILKEKGFW